jgi:hypothetical protein
MPYQKGEKNDEKQKHQQAKQSTSQNPSCVHNHDPAEPQSSDVLDDRPVIEGRFYKVQAAMAPQTV